MVWFRLHHIGPSQVRYRFPYIATIYEYLRRLYLLYKHTNVMLDWNSNPRPGRGVDATPLRFFCDAPQTMRRIVLKLCIAYGASFAQLLEKN